MRNKRIRARRSGVVLLVVLTLLAIFTVVGLSFVYYAQAQAAEARLWTESASVQLAQTTEVARTTIEDLIKANAGQIDFSRSRAEIEALLKAATALRDEVCRAAAIEQDPAERHRLQAMCQTQEQFVKALARLKWIIEQM